MREFDKSKPYQVVYGNPGASFEQHGILYDAAGNIAAEVEMVLEPEVDPVPSEKQEYFETGETDWKEFPKAPEVVVEEKQEETLPAFTIPSPVDEEKAKRSSAASERMKAYWDAKRAKEANVE